jgi:gamma-glutamylcyclotransferase (GGCT)/AIG2-like uncharacterized protein YtfP
MKLFVYGTLLQTCTRFYTLQSLQAKFICKDEILAAMYTPNREWPFIVVAPNIFTVVTGEVYEIDDEKISTIDRIEGYRQQKNLTNNLFNRIEVTTLREHTVFTYVGGHYLQKSIDHDSNLRRIDYGDWVTYIRMLEGYSRNTKKRQRNRQSFFELKEKTYKQE